MQEVQVEYCCKIHGLGINLHTIVSWIIQSFSTRDRIKISYVEFIGMLKFDVRKRSDNFNILRVLNKVLQTIHPQREVGKILE